MVQPVMILYLINIRVRAMLKIGMGEVKTAVNHTSCATNFGNVV